MSDTVINRLGPEKRRTIASIAAALVIHAGLFALIGVLADVGMRRATLTPSPIDIQIGPLPGLEDSGGYATAGTAASGSPSAAVGIPGAPASSASNLQASTGGGFVIPTPSGQSPDQALAPSGSAFRQAGGSAGSAQSLPAVQSPLSPSITAGSKATGTGQGTGSVQHSGEGVVVGQAASGSLDLGQLDKAIAGSGSAAGTGQTGTGSAGTGTGAGGTGSASTGAGSAGSANPKDYSVLWDQPQASTGREVVSAPKPRLPQWVSTQGLTLKVSVGFTLLADGVVSSVTLEQSSGYADVDSAMLDAIRRWRFTALKGAPAVKGLIPYVIRTKESSLTPGG